jgi:hypothetical protein
MNFEDNENRHEVIRSLAGSVSASLDKPQADPTLYQILVVSPIANKATDTERFLGSFGLIERVPQ